MSAFDTPTAPLGLFVGPADAPDRYELLAERAAGGEGRLYSARFDTNEAGMLRLAVKALGAVAPGASPDRWLANRAVLRTVHHPNIVRYLDHFSGPAPHGIGQRPAGPEEQYEVMEWIDGVSLAGFVRATGSGAPAERWALVVDLAEAVDHLHAASSDTLAMVHRDIKPANVVVHPARGAVLVDFGLARPEVVPATTPAAGTDGYRAPELTDGGSPSRESDRWSTAATAHFVLTGSAPSSGTRAQLASVAERLGREPDALVGVFEQALARDPAERPTSMVTWAHEVAAIIASADVVPRGRTTTGSAPTGRRRPRRAVLATALVAVGALATGSVYAVSHRHRTPASAAAPGPPCRVDPATPKVANAQGLSRAVATCTLSVGAALFTARDVQSPTVGTVQADGRSMVFCKTLGSPATGPNALGGTITSPRWGRVHLVDPSANGSSIDGWSPEYSFRSDLTTLRWCGSGER